jgi:radical SAM peptide maturase (CXXX-repeat target family)
MRETNALYKKVKLYRYQFEVFEMQTFGSYKTLRLRYDAEAIAFRLKYMYTHNKDTSNAHELHEKYVTLMDELRNTYCHIMLSFISQLFQINNKYDLKNIAEVIITHIELQNQQYEFDLAVLSDNEECLHYLDEIIKDNEVYDMFPDKFFRFDTISYSDAIQKVYPELFSIGNDLNNKDNSIFVHNFTFQTTENCNLNCSPAGTKILMADFTQKNIEDIQVGDMVLGFEESIEYKKQRSLIPTRVTKLFKHNESCYKITSPWLKDELYFTPDHPILTGRGKWVKVKDLAPSDTLMMTEFDADDFYDIDITNTNYIKGYFIAGWMGDGCTIQSMPKDKYLRHFMRFAVKDEEMTKRMQEYAQILGFEFSIIDYKISEKYDITTFALYSGKKSEYDKWITLCDEMLYTETHSPEFLMGFLAGIYDAEGSVSSTLRIHISDKYIMGIIEKGLNFLKIKYTYDKPKKPANKTVQTIRILEGSKGMLRFMKSVKNAIPRKGPLSLIGKSLFKTINCISKEYIPDAKTVYNFETTEHTYISNSILVHNCTYCYQINKTAGRMPFETAKKFIDKLLNDEYGYLNRNNSPAIILEFIGGDPLLEINLTKKIYEYFLDRCYELNHPWFALHRLSICSNGMLYFDRDVQDFFKKYAQNVSFNISIDGNKELQDACRIQPNGEGSYDIDIIALNHYNKYHTVERNSKMTLAPENIGYLYDSVVSFINEKMESINLNCVFEEVWSLETATLEYKQLKKLADYILEHNLEHLYIAIFDDRSEERLDRTSDSNFCFRGDTLIQTPEGHKRIDEMKLNDIVISEIGGSEKVTKFHSRIAKDTMSIRATGMFKTYTTSNHPYLTKQFSHKGNKGVYRYNDPEWIPAGKLRKGDKIALSMHKFGNIHIDEKIAIIKILLMLFCVARKI